MALDRADVWKGPRRDDERFNGMMGVWWRIIFSS
jgi:hypothetical protein